MNPSSPIRKVFHGIADRRQMYRMFDRDAQRPTLGGDCAGTRGTRRYLVPSQEYGTSGGRSGFVIDEARHRLYDGPSSFVGWKR